MIWRCDLVPQYEALKAEIDEAIARVLSSGRYVLGDNVTAFEQEFSAFVGVRFGIGVNSGTDALIMALRLCDLRPGDEVITTAFTAIPTYAAIRHVGAVPRLIDIDADTFLMDVGKVAAALNERTRAVVPVHLFGNPVDIDALRAVVGPNIFIVEDCAQAHGATIRGRRVGSIGDFGAFSFYPSKNLGGYGDGGMLVTNREHGASAARRQRTYGMINKDEFVEDGVNTRLDELQAAILRVKLKYLERMNERRACLAERYRTRLDARHFAAQAVSPHASSVFHVYSGVCDGKRDELVHDLERAGIQTNVYYPMPLNCQRGYAGPDAGVRFPVAETVSRSILALPFYPELPEETVDTIAAAVARFYTAPVC